MTDFLDGVNAESLLLPQYIASISNGGDTINGTNIAETLAGGNGDDILDGNQGSDVLLGGNGKDLLIWDPGDGSDVLDGGNGVDTHLFNMADVGELVTLIEQGGHAILARSGSVVMDIDNVERIAFAGAGGGADTFFIGELSATDVRAVDIDLGLAPDNAVDSVSAMGTAARDHVTIASADGAHVVEGLSVDVSVSHAEATDRLVVNALDGDDVIDARDFAGGVSLTLWGGNGADQFLFGPSAGAAARILDFRTHAAGGDQADTISLEGFADASFTEAVANGHIAQDGSNVVVSDGGGAVVTLANVSLADLGADDFLFG